MLGYNQLESVAFYPYYYWGFGDDFVFGNHGRVRRGHEPDTRGMKDAFRKGRNRVSRKPVIGARNHIWAGKAVENPRLHPIRKINVGCGATHNEFPHLEFD